MLTDEPGCHRHPVLAGDAPEQVLDVRSVGVVVNDVVACRIGLIVADERLDLGSHGGREQHHLPVGCGAVEETAHRGEESHVGHAVGFVDDDRPHGTEVDGALCDEVLQTARTGHDGVDTPSECLARGAVSRAAVDGDDAPTAWAREQGQLAHDLGGQFARGHQDECSGAARLRPVGPAHDGQPEGQGLP